MKTIFFVISYSICSAAFAQSQSLYTEDTLPGPRKYIAVRTAAPVVTNPPVWTSATVNNLQGVTVQTISKPNSNMPQVAGIERMSLKDIKNIPVFLGERDLMKTIQLLPGIKSAGDGNSGFYVRGGSADQNLILLDGAPVYNASHLMGFFSVFNGDAIRDFSLFKGNMPAQYGGRLSSVLDVNMNEGNKEAFKLSGGIGLIAARLNTEGPMLNNKGSFLVSGRRTYADMLLKLSKDSSLRKNDLNFYDVNVKLSYKAGNKDELSISAYMGHDIMRVNKVFGLEWGNKVASARWRHQFSNNTSFNSTLFYSNYDYSASITSSRETVATSSRINDAGGKMMILWKMGDHEVKAGTDITYHSIEPSRLVSTTGKGASQPEAKRPSVDLAVYMSDSWKVSNRLQFTYGVRLSSFSVLGSGDFYTTDSRGQIKDTLRYAAGEIVKTYVNVEPRAAATYMFTKAASINMSYTRNVQPLHLLANTTAATPADKWISSNNLIQPEIADQLSIGYIQKINDNRYVLCVEGYYKAMQNQLEYRDGAEVFSNDPVETKVLAGRGRAYGAEFLVKKKKGNLTGWIGYTLSKTERQVNGINNDNWYNARQDRTHEVSVVVSLKLSDRWSVSSNWVYNTGNAVTMPAGKYVVNNRMVYYYTNRNAYRMPAYHRLDIAATVLLSRKNPSSSELNFGLYNAYGRENAYSVYIRSKDKDPLQTEAVQLALFRFVPSVTYNFKF